MEELFNSFFFFFFIQLPSKYTHKHTAWTNLPTDNHETLQTTYHIQIENYKHLQQLQTVKSRYQQSTSMASLCRPMACHNWIKLVSSEFSIPLLPVKALYVKRWQKRRPKKKSIGHWSSWYGIDTTWLSEKELTEPHQSLVCYRFNCKP